ncbi:MAG: glycosyltransferase family 9 protein [bacterium]|nr:glycosyltransferase family 9 protein [bacterium]
MIQQDAGALSLRYRFDQRLAEEKLKIVNELNFFREGPNLYRLAELADDLVVKIERTETNLDAPQNIHCHIGFPFPIDSFIYTGKDIKIYRGVSVEIFLRGEDIRKCQRDELFKNVGNVHIIDDDKEFNSIIQSDFKDAESLLYVDPYDFIGDSIIGLYCLDSFKKSFGRIHNVHVFSSASKHINALYPSSPKNDDEILSKITPLNNFILMPDFIDNQWMFTVKTILKLGNVPYRIAIPGRNLYIKNENNKKEIFWLKRDDFLLRNQNIEDYMNATLKPFLGSKFEKPFGRKTFAHKNGQFIYLNPFASRKEKIIPPHIFLSICEVISKKYDLQFKLIGGMRENDLQQQWVNEFFQHLGISTKIKLDVVYYKNLSELYLDLTNNCALVITADTGIAHLANYGGHRNIVLYNLKSWDICSVQSMCSDSPLGFCRYSKSQIPVVLNDDPAVITDIVNLIDLLLSLQKTEKKLVKGEQINWLLNLYDPAILTSCLQKMNKKAKITELLSAAIKISPQYKIAGTKPSL